MNERTKPFFTYMQENAELARYVTVVSQGNMKDEKSRIRFINLKKNSQIEAVFNLKKIKKKIKKLKNLITYQSFSRPPYLPNSQRLNFHRLKFLENSLTNYKAKIKKWKSLCYTKVCNLFETKGLIPAEIHVIFEGNRALNFLKHKKHKISAIKIKMQNLHLAIKQKIPIRLSNDKQIEFLQKTINQILPSFDESLAFFVPVSYQDQFEQYLYHPDFIWSETVSTIIQTFSATPPIEFVNEIVKLVEKIGTKIERTDTYSLSILVGLCFRAFFDAVYPQVKLFFVPELSFDLIAAMKCTKLSDIDPPRQCCPPGAQDDQLICDIFRNDPNYSFAVEQVEFISFFTNPLDILHHIYHSLQEIEKATAVYNKGETSVLSFDATFGLFLCVILSSNIPELMRIAMFTEQFSPKQGLSPDFEFALAKLSTASVHLQNRAQSQMEK